MEAQIGCDSIIILVFERSQAKVREECVMIAADEVRARSVCAHEKVVALLEIDVLGSDAESVVVGYGNVEAVDHPVGESVLHPAITTLRYDPDLEWFEGEMVTLCGQINRAEKRNYDK